MSESEIVAEGRGPGAGEESHTTADSAESAAADKDTITDPRPPAPGPKLSDSLGLLPDLVAAGTPTPGGGSVAAQSGVMAAALGQMMCNITIGKKKFAAAESRLKEIRDELERLGARLRELIAEDAESFEAVLRAYRMPKETEDQKRERDAQIEAAMRGAVEVPFETAERSFQVLKRLAELADIGNPNALSDVAVGALLAQAAARGASYNVYVNLSSFSDLEAADLARQKMARLISDARTIAEEIESKVNA